MDLRTLVNVQNLRLSPITSHFKLAENRLKQLMSPLQIRLQVTKYELEPYMNTHADANAHVHHHQRQKQHKTRRVSPEIPEGTCGVICLMRENVCGGLCLDTSGVSVHQRAGRDLPPGFFVLKPQSMTDYELCDPHMQGYVQLMWMIEQKDDTSLPV